MYLKENNLLEFPLISVVVITYNSSKTIIETLDSIKAQTYHDIELIITDDASKDDTIEKSRGWIAGNIDRFSDTKVIGVEENGGIPANCNRGCRAAKGIFVKLIAGDDALLPSCLMDNAKYLLQKREADILLSQMEIFDTNFVDDCSLGIWKSDALTNFFPDAISASAQYSLLLHRDRIGNTPTIFLRSNIFEEIGYYDEDFPWIEDYPFWLKATKAGKKVYFLDLVTVKYRKHLSSIHNNGIVHFMLPSYFLNEKVREKYIYPNLGFRQRLHKKYNYNMALIFKIFTRNKYYPLVSKFYNLITFQSKFYSKLFQS